MPSDDIATRSPGPAGTRRRHAIRGFGRPAPQDVWGERAGHRSMPELTTGTTASVLLLSQQPERRPRRQLGSCRGGLPDNRGYAPTRGWLRTLVALLLSCSRLRSSFGVVPRHAVRPRSRAAMRRGVCWHSWSKDRSRRSLRRVIPPSRRPRSCRRDRRPRTPSLGHFHHDLPAIPVPLYCYNDTHLGTAIAIVIRCESGFACHCHRPLNRLRNER